MSKRIRDLKTPTTAWREWIFRAVGRPFALLSEDQRFWLGFAALSIITTLLIQNPFWRSSLEQTYSEGDIARESIVSPADIYFSDTEESERLKNEAKHAIKPIFRYESNKAEQAVQGFLSSWEKLQRHGGESAANSKSANADTKAEARELPCCTVPSYR